MYINRYNLLSFYFLFLMVYKCKSDSITVCNNSSNRLLFVSTLDGRFTALNVENNGVEQWSIATDPGSMLCSNIHNVELIDDSQFIRLIPSLNGGLYKFNGKHVQPIPVNADSLLSTSFRFSDDTVISGGKEVHSYGLNVVSGQILYQCSMNKCSNFTKSLDNYVEMMILQRSTHTVRAVDPYNGNERWNYSVSQHDIKLLPNTVNDCNFNYVEELDVDIKVMVSDGLIFAYSKSKPDLLIWQHQFPSPIANVWSLIGHKLNWIDLFGASFITNAINRQSNVNPSLYIGTHEKQLYIQESEALENYIIRAFSSAAFKSNCSPRLPRIPYKPTEKRINSLRKIPELTDESTSNTALSNTEYVNVNAGHYLYDVELDGEEIDDINKYRISNSAKYSTGYAVSLSHWWKEILAVCMAASFLMNFLCDHRLHSFIRNLLKMNKSNEERAKSLTESEFNLKLVKTSVQSANDLIIDTYNSRFFNDFEPVCILGKGGFGIVFEAKNRIDDCHYAIKRITLPNRTDSRDRVMREVKALAKLEHQNIVRYFNAWQECPPSGWQEKQDKVWLNKIGRKFNESSLFFESSENPSKTNTKSDIPDNDCNTIDSGFDFNNVKHTGNVFSKRPKETDTNNSSFIIFDVEKSNNITTATQTSSTENDERTNAENVIVTKTIEKLPRIYLYIQMQLCQQNSLQEWLQSHTTRDKQDVLLIFEQIVQAVEYVHMQGLIHRDLKPSNIFFAPDGQIKIGDFGLVTEMIETKFQNSYKYDVNDCDYHTARVGTRLYMSPEQVNGTAYNYKVDIYSLGIILFELLIPFCTEMERCTAITNARNGKFPNSFKTKFKDEYDLLTLMLSEFPEKRPTTYGIKLRLPFSRVQSDNCLDNEWEFELPRKRSRTRSSNSFCQTFNVQNDDFAVAVS